MALSCLVDYLYLYVIYVSLVEAFTTRINMWSFSLGANQDIKTNSEQLRPTGQHIFSIEILDPSCKCFYWRRMWLQGVGEQGCCHPLHMPTFHSPNKLQYTACCTTREMLLITELCAPTSGIEDSLLPHPLGSALATVTSHRPEPTLVSLSTL